MLINIFQKLVYLVEAEMTHSRKTDSGDGLKPTAVCSPVFSHMVIQKRKEIRILPFLIGLGRIAASLVFHQLSMSVVRISKIPPVFLPLVDCGKSGIFRIHDWRHRPVADPGFCHRRSRV